MIANCTANTAKVLVSLDVLVMQYLKQLESLQFVNND